MSKIKDIIKQYDKGDSYVRKSYTANFYNNKALETPYVEFTIPCGKERFVRIKVLKEELEHFILLMEDNELQWK